MKPRMEINIPLNECCMDAVACRCFNSFVNVVNRRNIEVVNTDRRNLS